MNDKDALSLSRIPLSGGPVPPAPAPAPSALTLEEREIAALDLGAAFELASAELGFRAASWIFVEQVAAAGGDDAVARLRDELGRSFSVLHFIAERWLRGERTSRIDTTELVQTLTGARRVLVVGVEAGHLDALAHDLAPDVRLGLLTYRMQRVDWERVIANYNGRVEPVDLGEFQGWAGARSTILTFVYGTRGDLANVLSAFLRISGPDVRTQFRDVVGWDVLGAAPEVYPRYLVETSVSDLTALISFDGG